MKRTKKRAKTTLASKAKKVLKFPEDRDTRIQREEDLRAARVLYEEWKHDFINRRKPISELAGCVNELAATLERKIKTKEIRDYVINDLLNPLMVRLHQAAELEAITVDVVIDCPGKLIAKDTGAESECGWGGIAKPYKKQWEAGTVTMVCPECAQLLRQKGDMMLKADVEKMAKEVKRK